MAKGEGRERFIWLELEGERRAATLSLSPSVSVYGERTVEVKGAEYRVWDPYRSKLAAAMLLGLKELPVQSGMRILYLGVSTGTTASHVSDIIGPSGVLFGVEVAPRVAREFLDRVARHRENVIPVVEDARRPERCLPVFSQVDIVYCDIAQPDQTDIAILNCRRFLKNEGDLLLIVKAPSIDVTKSSEDIFREERAKLLNAGFTIKQHVRLEPYDRDHALIWARLSH